MGRWSPDFFLGPLQPDTNPRVHKASGPSVGLLSSSSEKAGQVLHRQPPCVPCAQPELPLPVLEAVLLRATVWGTGPPSCDSSRSAAWKAAPACSSREVPAGPRVAGFGVHTELRSSVAAAANPSQVTCAACGQQAPDIPPPGCRPCSLGIPQERVLDLGCAARRTRGAGATRKHDCSAQVPEV